MEKTNAASVNNIMKPEKMLPADFDGVFRFTNNSDEEFIGKWGGKEYIFPPRSTSPMIMPEFTPLEIQQIRKKFAKDWAEHQFFQSKKYEVIRSREGEKDEMNMIRPRGQGMSHAGTYSLNDLVDYIQQCLKPLPISKAIVQEGEKIKIEESLTRNKKGNLNTKAVEDDDDLKKLAKGE